MTQQEALAVLIAVGVCSTGDLTCKDCPMHQGVSEGEHDTCFDCWNEHEVAEAVKVLREAADSRGRLSLQGEGDVNA